MNLVIVPHTHIDQAWADGASCLSEACATSGGEITGSQLKMILSRNERYLVRMDDDGGSVGWGVVRIDQLPNTRSLHITDLVCHNNGFQRFFGELKKMAASTGCSEVRYSAKEAQARLYRMKLKDEDLEAVYTTYRVKL